MSSSTWEVVGRPRPAPGRADQHGAVSTLAGLCPSVAAAGQARLLTAPKVTPWSLSADDGTLSCAARCELTVPRWRQWTFRHYI